MAEQFRHEVFCDHHVRGTNVTLCETRVAWDGEGEWTHQSYAQLRYRRESKDWALYWAHRNSRWHPYDYPGTHLVGTCAYLLAEIDTDPSAFFKG